MTSRTILAACLGLALASGCAAGSAEVGDLKIGDAAPPFSLQGSDGKTHSLEENLGKRAVVIAWFPKAFTSG